MAAAAAAARSEAEAEGQDVKTDQQLQEEAFRRNAVRGWRCILTTAFVFGYVYLGVALWLPYPSEWWFLARFYESEWKDQVKHVDCSDASASGFVLLNCEMDGKGSNVTGPGAFRNHAHAGIGLRTITEVLRCVKNSHWYLDAQGERDWNYSYSAEWQVIEDSRRLKWKERKFLNTSSASFQQNCGVENPVLSSDPDFPMSGTNYADSVRFGSFVLQEYDERKWTYSENAHSKYYYHPVSGYQHVLQDVIPPLDSPVEWPEPLPEGWEAAVEMHDGQRSIMYYRKPTQPSGVLLNGTAIGTIRTRFMSNAWNHKDVTVVGEVMEHRSNGTRIEFNAPRSSRSWMRYDTYRDWRDRFAGMRMGTWSKDEMWNAMTLSSFRQPYFEALGDPDGFWLLGMLGPIFGLYWIGHFLVSSPFLFCMGPNSFLQVVANAFLACLPALAVVLLHLAWPWFKWTPDWWIGLLMVTLATVLCSIRCCCCPRVCVVCTPFTQRWLEAARRSMSSEKESVEAADPSVDAVSEAADAKLLMCRVVGASHDSAGGADNV